jgi:hypothetical protein
MRLGISSKKEAQLVACELEALPSWLLPDEFDREAWCSETISYWHKEAGIPYDVGYSNSTWNLNWQLDNTAAIRAFYEVEELKTAMAATLGPLSPWERGRGRWIEWSDLDYTDFRPGENAPVPGAYVMIRGYEGSAFVDNSTGHSMMIDEMTVYGTVGGQVQQVKITLVEGNRSDQVTDYRVVDDVLSVTPYGNDYVDQIQNGTMERRIVGFGIDLDQNGDPIYDEDRLHFVWIADANPIIPDIRTVRDPFWETQYAPLVQQLANYARKVAGGIEVHASSDQIQAVKIPDQRGVQWLFPATLDEEVEIEIDLLDVHPLPIQGLILAWDGGFLPRGYHVLWAGADHVYHPAEMPSMTAFVGPNDPRLVVPVPVLFGRPGERVRYVKLVFSEGTFEQVGILKGLRFCYEWGPDEDAPYNP